MLQSRNTGDEKFINFHEKLESVLTKYQIDDFKTLKNNYERVRFIINLEQRPKLPIKIETNRGKHLEKARRCKDLGNQYFREDKFGSAFFHYSQAILRSSPKISEFSAELPLYYANRSAALYHLKKYKMSIRDADFALKIGYPKELKYKIFDRKARCFLAMDKHQRAYEVFQQTISALDVANIPLEKRQKWQKDIQIMLLLISKNKKQDKSVLNDECSNKTTMKGKRNVVYEALTSAITIKSTKELGRFGVAKVDIKAGEVVLIEDAHCAVLLQKYQSTNCHMCFRRVEILEPCPTCDQVIFCSHECKNKAMSTFHDVECSILSGLWSSELSLTCIMALRIITQHKLQYFLDKRQNLIEIKRETFTKLNSSQYESVHNLVTHEERRKGEDLLNRSYVAVYLLECLKKTSYFDAVIQNRETFTDEEIYIAELLLHHLQVLQFNAHEVSEVQIWNNNIETCSSEFIGGALYPTLALLNHSCNPSVIRYFEGTRVITVTIKNIKAGEMVGENYGPLFFETRKNERQKNLNKLYWFDCTCDACVNDWPISSDMNQLKDIRLRCSNKKCNTAININPNVDNFLIQCELCSQNVNMFKPLKALQDSDEKFSLARSYMKMNKTKKALEELLKVLHLFDEYLVPPYKDLYLCQEAIRTCFLFMGNLCKFDSK